MVRNLQVISSLQMVDFYKKLKSDHNAYLRVVFANYKQRAQTCPSSRAGNRNDSARGRQA